jgi:1-deoxy-D-xylulose-5-phosphate reductoisomerase
VRGGGGTRGGEKDQDSGPGRRASAARAEAGGWVVTDAIRGVAILGSTGSIGLSTLDVLSRHPNRYRVVALTAWRQVDRLFAQCRQLRPEFAVMADPDAALELKGRVRAEGLPVTVLAGMDGLESVVSLPQVDTVMAAIVGAVGLRPTLAAVRNAKRVLIANKEPLVMVGDLITSEAHRHGALLLPVDSEHNAIFQCMPASCMGDDATGVGAPLAKAGVKRILLTGSGGPFRTLPLAELEQVTPEQACAHPNWSMGRKISVDSATMMNKGLELIEACKLFRTGPESVEIVVHPQSVVHSMVEYADGSVLAQLGNPDMRTPIAHALAWPQRIDSGVGSLDLFSVARLDFEAPDVARFPCLRLAQEAARAGGTSPAILNAANEVAVHAFLENRIRFTAIAQIVEETLAAVPAEATATLEAALAADEMARTVATDKVALTSGGVPPLRRHTHFPGA